MELILKVMEFVLTMMEFILKIMDFIHTMMDFIDLMRSSVTKHAVFDKTNPYEAAALQEGSYWELQYKCKNSSIENAEIMENCPWKTIIRILIWPILLQFEVYAGPAAGYEKRWIFY